VKLPIKIYQFYTVYEDDPKNPGKMRERDMAEYGPIGHTNTKVVERIDILSKPIKVAGANPSAFAAQALWAFLEPHYKAWKNNQDLPETGTPLAAWNYLTAQQAEVLRTNGVRTVEDVAELTDTHIQKMQIRNLRPIIEMAKKYIATSSKNGLTAEMIAKDETIAALTARIDQMAEMIAAQAEDRPRRGRPPKEESKEEAA
jgi:hypothetical protein